MEKRHGCFFEQRGALCPAGLGARGKPSRYSCFKNGCNPSPPPSPFDRLRAMADRPSLSHSPSRVACGDEGEGVSPSPVPSPVKGEGASKNLTPVFWRFVRRGCLSRSGHESLYHGGGEKCRVQSAECRVGEAVQSVECRMPFENLRALSEVEGQNERRKATRRRPSGYAGASGSRRDPHSTALRASLGSARDDNLTTLGEIPIRLRSGQASTRCAPSG